MVWVLVGVRGCVLRPTGHSLVAAPLINPYVLVFDAKGGEGSSMLVLGGATYLGGVYPLAYLLHLEFYVDTLCIELHKCDCNSDTNVIVIYM